MVRWLRINATTVGGVDSVPVQRTKIYMLVSMPCPPKHSVKKLDYQQESTVQHRKCCLIFGNNPNGEKKLKKNRYICYAVRIEKGVKNVS